MSIVQDVWNKGVETYEAAKREGEKLLDRTEDAFEQSLRELERVAGQVEDIASEAMDELEEVLDAGASGLVAGFDAAISTIEHTGAATVNLIEAVPEALTNADAAWNLIERATMAPFEEIENSLNQSAAFAIASVESVYNTIDATAEAAYESTARSVTLLVDQLEHTYEDHVRIVELTIEIIGEDLRDMAQLTYRLTACSAGMLVYGLAKTDAVMFNFTPPLPHRVMSIPQSLVDSIKDRLSIDFDRVSFVADAHLPANYFDATTYGMTFSGVELGWTPLEQVVLLNFHYDGNRQLHRRRLAHELVHVKQMQEMGEMGFACAYGVGYAKAGFNYEKNPLEDEAFKFEDTVA